MAKIHLDRLQKKYKGVQVSGNNYAELVKQIFDTNIANVDRSLARQANYKWEAIGKKYRTKEIRLVLPAEEDVIPKRAIHVLKSAEKGNLIRDTLRDRLTKDLRKTFFDFPEESYITRRGAKAGRINPRLVQQFEKNIRETFNGYSRRDKKIGVPKNVHEIAVTEVRSSINNIKNSYTQKIIDNNPNLIVTKKWIHNPSLSRIRPRRGHRMVARRKAIPFNDFFKVPLYKEGGGRVIRLGETLMRHPHDPTAPASQNIACHCDYDIFIEKRKVA